VTDTRRGTDVRLVEVTPGALSGAVARLVGAGGRVHSLFAVDRPQGPEVRVTATDGDGDLLLRCPAAGDTVETVLDAAPALAWDEREARDLHGVRFAGHEPHRPLIRHPADSADWTTPVIGDDVHQIAVGPTHAGVIESGHFRFHVVGERIIRVDVQLFWKHRGLEYAARGLTADGALPVLARSCAACAVAHATAYAHAVEQARGMWPDDDLRRARTLLLELERLYNHLNDISAACSGVGFAPGAMAFAALKERAQRINARLFGHRFLFHTIAIGRSVVTIDEVGAEWALEQLAGLRAEIPRLWRRLLFDESLRDRWTTAGVLGADEAVTLGTVGPSARASGLGHDVRSESPRLWYPGFAASTPSDPAGHAGARIEARVVEIGPTLDAIEDVLRDPPAQGGVRDAGAATGFGVGRVESPRGESVCAVELDGGLVERVHLRSGSYANWPSVARAAEGGIVPDFPLVNKSFELCYACADR
jgi:Ni,Fe-hydrogenase III large subunit